MPATVTITAFYRLSSSPSSCDVGHCDTPTELGRHSWGNKAREGEQAVTESCHSSTQTI